MRREAILKLFVVYIVKSVMEITTEAHSHGDRSLPDSEVVAKMIVGENDP